MRPVASDFGFGFGFGLGWRAGVFGFGFVRSRSASHGRLGRGIRRRGPHDEGDRRDRGGLLMGPAQIVTRDRRLVTGVPESGARGPFIAGAATSDGSRATSHGAAAILEAMTPPATRTTRGDYRAYATAQAAALSFADLRTLCAFFRGSVTRVVTRIMDTRYDRARVRSVPVRASLPGDTPAKQAEEKTTPPGVTTNESLSSFSPFSREGGAPVAFRPAPLVWAEPVESAGSLRSDAKGRQVSLNAIVYARFVARNVPKCLFSCPWDCLCLPLPLGVAILSSTKECPCMRRMHHESCLEGGQACVSDCPIGSVFRWS